MLKSSETYHIQLLVYFHQLKKSTNNICKSLAENPDIPKNLDKAKEDKNKIKLLP